MLAACILTACIGANPARPPAAVSGGGRGSDVTELLKFAEQVSELSEADLRREIDESLVRQRSDPSAEETIRYALLHVLGNARFTDPAAAARALEEVLSRSAYDDDDYVKLAVVLQEFLRASVSVSNAAAPRDSSNRVAAGADRQAELDRIRAELDNERARRLELERQLDELRSLEEALSDRAGFEDEPNAD